MRPTFPHIDWSITQACNYSCHYCHATSETPKGKLPVEDLHKELKKQGGNWTITISGGEPLIHPDIVRSCQILAQDFDLIINTNLTKTASLEEILRTVPLNRIRYFDVSLHIEERLKHKDGIDVLIHNVNILKKTGVNYHVNYVLHPALLDRVEADLAFFKRRGVDVIPKRFKGTWLGEKYPSSYGEREIRMMKPSADYSTNKAYYDFLGVPCRAGKDLAKIKSDGKASRCPGDKSPYGQLGNLNEGTFNLKKKSSPCNVSQCPCWGPDSVELNERDALFLRGINAYLENDFDDSRRCFESMIKADDRSANAIHNLALLDWRRGDRSEALKGFERAFRMIPKKNLYRESLSTALYLAEETAKAKSLTADKNKKNRMTQGLPISAEMSLCLQFRPRPDEAKSGWRLTAKKTWLKLLAHPVSGAPLKEFVESPSGQKMLNKWRAL